MSYHVTILRTGQGKQLPISLEEVVSATSSIEGWRYLESPMAFEFQAKENSCTLWYQDGELWTKNPEKWQLDVMVTLAKRLNARVRGDEWETYDETGNAFQHHDDIPLRKEGEARSTDLLAKSMQQQRFIRNAIIGFFFVLGIVGFFIGKWFEQH
jgi:hypothetical protein